MDYVPSEKCFAFTKNEFQKYCMVHQSDIYHNCIYNKILDLLVYTMMQSSFLFSFSLVSALIFLNVHKAGVNDCFDVT